MTDEEDRPDQRGKGWRPVPDPTALTTEALQREVGTLRELVEASIESAEAVNLERFKAINERFSLFEALRLEQKADTKAAVDAALIAQKEAVAEQTAASEKAINKSEGTTIKSIDALAETFRTADAAQRRDVDDLKTRVTTVESSKAGGKESIAGVYQLFAAVLIVLGIIGAIVALAAG